MPPRKVGAGSYRALDWTGPDGPLSRVRDVDGAMLFVGSPVRSLLLRPGHAALRGVVVELVDTDTVTVRWEGSARVIEARASAVRLLPPVPS